MRQFGSSRLTPEPLERFHAPRSRAGGVPLPQVPASIFRIPSRGFRCGECGSIQRKTPVKAAHEYSYQETLQAPARRDRHLRGGVSAIPLIPALSHHGTNPIAGFQHSDFSSHHRRLCLNPKPAPMQRMNSPAWPCADLLGPPFAPCKAMPASQTSSPKPRGAERENPRRRAT